MEKIEYLKSSELFFQCDFIEGCIEFGEVILQYIGDDQGQGFFYVVLGFVDLWFLVCVII